MWYTTIVTNEVDLWKVVEFHLNQGDEIKIERCKGIGGEDLVKVLWKFEEEG